jgi:hypothetical protein
MHQNDPIIQVYNELVLMQYMVKYLETYGLDVCACDNDFVSKLYTVIRTFQNENIRYDILVYVQQIA